MVYDTLRRDNDERTTMDEGQMGAAEPRNPEFRKVLAEMQAIHDQRSRKYTGHDPDPFANFVGSARFAGVGTDISFRVLLGTKIERLRHMVEASDDGIDDSLLDLANYAALWLAWRRTQRSTPGTPGRGV